MPPRVLLALATGAGKTVIATNLLWRLSQAGQLPKPALFLCDRDELRGQAYTKLKAAFGDNARIVGTENGGNAAANPLDAVPTRRAIVEFLEPAQLLASFRGLSPASRPDRSASTPASSSPASTASPAAPSIRTSIAPAARPRITSKHGRRIWPPTAPHAAGPVPIRCGCFCMSAPIG